MSANRPARRLTGFCSGALGLTLPSQRKTAALTRQFFSPGGRCVRTGGARMAVGCPGEAPGPSVAPRAAPLALACCCCSAHAACRGGRFPRLRALASRARGRRGRVRAPARPAPPLPSRRSRPPPAPREHWRSGVCASAALSTPARARGACAWAERMRVPPTGRPPAPLPSRRRPRAAAVVKSQAFFLATQDIFIFCSFLQLSLIHI